MKSTLVVALGGNALLQKGEKSFEKQLVNAQKSMKAVAPLASKYNVVLTHGNGPQVGNILLRDESAEGKAPHLPLDADVAQTQGEIGYVLLQGLHSSLSKGKQEKVLPLVTRTLVDSKDKGFKNPTKPIGPFYSTSAFFKKKKIPFVKQIGRGYRRVVASPVPISIVEHKLIKKLSSLGYIVITCGGGGIPVVSKRGKLVGVEAVVDKDLASSCLAQEIGAKELVILTDTEKVRVNFKKKNEKKLGKVTVKIMQEYLRSGEFPPGSMGPKVAACIDFILSGGKRAIITSPSHLSKALRGQSGTIITK